ncbi:MAG: signal recognition particle-docking protein FtsY [Myxococcota bacterium]
MSILIVAIGVVVGVIGIVVMLAKRAKRGVAQAPQPEAVVPVTTDLWGSALQRTRQRLQRMFVQHDSQRAEALWQHMEETLIGADVGVRTTQKLLAHTKQRLQGQAVTLEAVLQALKQEALQMMRTGCKQAEASAQQEAASPQVWLFVGINGAGKTTTIGKLAHRLTQEGKRVVIAAGDTFRAAALQQLQTWAQRADAVCVAKQEGADPASVLFEAVAQAKAQRADVVLCDTAGRLHSHQSLMDQLNKMYRVLAKACAGAPHEAILVLDAHIGQNALVQAKQFSETVNLTGVVMAKLDGTARGGVLLAIANELGLPVRYVGLGESVQQLQPFEPQQFVDALFAPQPQVKQVAQQQQPQQVQQTA